MSDLTDDINEALVDAVNDGDGRPRKDALEHYLRKRGLEIVRSDERDRLRTALEQAAGDLERAAACFRKDSDIGKAIASFAEDARKALATASPKPE